MTLTMPDSDFSGSNGAVVFSHSNYTTPTLSRTTPVTDGILPDPEESYDSWGAMQFIVVTLSVYGLLGIFSLLLVRIVRRAKMRLQRHRHNYHEEFLSVRRYLHNQPRLQMEGHRQKLMHQKTVTALALWNTEIPELNQPFLKRQNTNRHPRPVRSLSAPESRPMLHQGARGSSQAVPSDLHDITDQVKENSNTVPSDLQDITDQTIESGNSVQSVEGQVTGNSNAVPLDLKDVESQIKESSEAVPLDLHDVTIQEDGQN